MSGLAAAFHQPCRRGLIVPCSLPGQGVPVEDDRVGFINLENAYRDGIVDEKKLIHYVSQVLDEAGCREFDIGIVLADDEYVQSLNREHRGVDAPTDVLSFPFHDEALPGEVPRDVPRDDADLLNLGDIIISIPYVQRVCEADAANPPELAEDDDPRGVAAAMATEIDLEARLHLLVIHGIAHLMSYDHETDDEFDEMVQVEDRLITRLRSAQAAYRDSSSSSS